MGDDNNGCCCCCGIIIGFIILYALSATGILDEFGYWLEDNIFYVILVCLIIGCILLYWVLGRWIETTWKRLAIVIGIGLAVVIGIFGIPVLLFLSAVGWFSSLLNVTGLILLSIIIAISGVAILLYRRRNKVEAERRWRLEYERRQTEAERQRQEAEDAERRLRLTYNHSNWQTEETRRNNELFGLTSDDNSDKSADYEYKENPDGSFTRVKKRR